MGGTPGAETLFIGWLTRIEWTQRCTWRAGSSELRDALGGRDRASLEMHFEAVIVRVWKCTLRPWSSKVGDAIGDRDWVNSEMHWEAVIERVWTCTCSKWSSEIGGVLGSGWFGWRRDGSWLSIHCSTCNCGNVESWVQQHPPRDGKLAGSGTLSILGWFCTWCMLHSAWRDREGWLNFVFLGDDRVEHKKERDQRRWGKSSWETGTSENFVCESIYHPRYGR